MKIVATTLKHMDLQTTLNHYVDFTYPKDTFSVVHRLDTRQDLPGPSGWLQRRITHGSGGLLGAVLQVANSDPVLERESLMCHLLGMAGASTRGASSAVRRRRGHIMRHTPDALYREDAAALAVSDPCASDAVVGREDDAWAQQLQGVAVSDYAEALVLGVFGFGEGRRRLGLPVAEASSRQGLPRLGRDLSHVYRLSPNTCWRVLCCSVCGSCFGSSRSAKQHISKCTATGFDEDAASWKVAERMDTFNFWQQPYFAALVRFWVGLRLWREPSMPLVPCISCTTPGCRPRWRALHVTRPLQ